MSKKTNKESHRGRALDLWQAPEKSGDPLVCLATTFTFDATFFETECLGRFLQMDSHPDETESVGYLVEREEKLAIARVAVLVDRRHAQSKESLRWDVIPILVRAAAQHAKLSVLCWSDRIRIIIGSGNLTEPGYRKNVEMFGTLDAARDEPGPIAQVRSCLDFLDRMLDLAVGEAEGSGPLQRARQAISSVRSHVSRWVVEEERSERSRVVFGGLGPSVLDEIAALWPSSRPARHGGVLSPFFDRENPTEPTRHLLTLLAQRGTCQIKFYPPGEKLPSGQLRVAAPKSMIKSVPERIETSVFIVPLEQDEEQRPLHAKSMYLENDDWTVVMLGSSNFTRAGLSLGTGPSNLEANLVYALRLDNPLDKQLRQVWPRYDQEPVDLDSPEILWEPTFEDEGEGETTMPLPAAFCEALFNPREPAVEIILREDLPNTWSIRIPNGDEILESAHNGAGRHKIPWNDRPVPFILDVTWTITSGTYAAAWPLNVSDLSSLPPPEELQSLTLEEMLAVLASTRPLHVAVEQVIARRKQVPASRNGAVLDPLKRVSTETFLLQRTRRVARALERLKERLERPAFNRDAFEWRLSGPIGAITLARAFQKEARSPDEGRFFQAELALTLRAVQVTKVALGGLDLQTVREQLLSCIEEIQALVISTGSADTEPIDCYVREAFQEARR